MRRQTLFREWSSSCWHLLLLRWQARRTAPQGCRGRAPHLLLSEERDGLAQRAQHGADLAIVGGHHGGADAPPQLKLAQQRLLLIALAARGLRRRTAVAWRRRQQQEIDSVARAARDRRRRHAASC